jgi:hypothetical protein
MNTLGKEITQGFFEDENGYQKFIARWSEMMNDKNVCKDINAEEHLLYLALRGKDWRKGLTAATNKNKVENGYNGSQYGDWGGNINRIVYGARGIRNDYHFLCFFKGIINEEGLRKVRQYITNSNKPIENDAYVDEVK